MSDRHHKLHELLLADLAELKLAQIAQTYREVLDEAARKNASLLATAMIDRLMHHGEAIVIQGESYRTKDNDKEEGPLPAPAGKPRPSSPVHG